MKDMLLGRAVAPPGPSYIVWKVWVGLYARNDASLLLFLCMPILIGELYSPLGTDPNSMRFLVSPM